MFHWNQRQNTAPRSSGVRARSNCWPATLRNRTLAVWWRVIALVSIAWLPSSVALGDLHVIGSPEKLDEFTATAREGLSDGQAQGSPAELWLDGSGRLHVEGQLTNEFALRLEEITSDGGVEVSVTLSETHNDGPVGAQVFLGAFNRGVVPAETLTSAGNGELTLNLDSLRLLPTRAHPGVLTRQAALMGQLWMAYVGVRDGIPFASARAAGLDAESAVLATTYGGVPWRLATTVGPTFPGGGSPGQYSLVYSDGGDGLAAVNFQLDPEFSVTGIEAGTVSTDGICNQFTVNGCDGSVLCTVSSEAGEVLIDSIPGALEAGYVSYVESDGAGGLFATAPNIDLAVHLRDGVFDQFFGSPDRSLPGGLAHDPLRSELFVSYEDPPGITVFSVEAEGEILRDFDVEGLDGPADIALDATGTLWVSNHFGGNVLRVDPLEGAVLSTIEHPAMGDPAGIAVGGAEVFVVNNTDASVLAFSMAGDLERVVSTQLELSSPWGVSVPHSGPSPFAMGAASPLAGSVAIADTGLASIYLVDGAGSIIEQITSPSLNNVSHLFVESTVKVSEPPPPTIYEPGTKHIPLARPFLWEPCPSDKLPFADDAFLDPVYLFSGELFEPVVDLRIPGVGFDFIWARKYRSRVGKDTAQGNGWDFSYNVHLEKAGADLVLHDGNSRRDLYLQQADGTWSAREFFRQIEQENDGSFTLHFADTGFWGFLPLDDATAPGRLFESVDRNGNTMRFEYAAGGRLVGVVDTLGRRIAIAYNAQDRIASVTDFSGRTVSYEYYRDGDAGGSAGDLRSVTSPAIVGTPNGNDFPDGKTTIYTYSTGHVDDNLNHNLLTITDPLGQTYLQNEYAATDDPTDLEYDRLLRQAWGNADEVLDLRYERVVPAPDNNQAVLKAILNDRMGNVHEVFYDVRNRMVVMREFTGRADSQAPTTSVANRPTDRLRSGDPEFFETRFDYNDDSLLTRTDYPNGNVSIHVYESELDASAAPRARGNLREHRRIPGVLGGEQPVLVESFQYLSDIGGCCGTSFVTRAEDPRGHVTVHEYDDRGNRVRTLHPIPGVVEDFEYNAAGQLTARIWPDNGSGHRRRDEYTFHQAGPQRGYLQSETIDAGGLQLTTQFEYDAVGNVTRVIDPRGNDTLYDVNADNQVVRKTCRAVTLEDADGEPITVRYQSDCFYDANDNKVREDVLNVDATGAVLPNSHITTRWDHEILNHVVRVTREVDEQRDVVVEIEYDANRNRTLIRQGEATRGADPNHQIRTYFDERDLKFQVVRGAGSDLESTLQYDYDGNGNVAATRNGLEGDVQVTRRFHDGYNRLVRVIDPMGNEKLIRHDPNGNRVSVRFEGELVDVDGGDGNIRLDEVTHEFDALNRMTRIDREFFVIDVSGGVATEIERFDGQSNTRIEYADASLITRITDDNGHATTFEYDTANRRRRTTDAAGNTVTLDFDANSNVVRRTDVELSDLGDPDQVFVTESSFDALDRLVSRTDSAGNTRELHYDSRDNRVLSIDTLGNATRKFFDGLDRPIVVERELNDGGTGDGDLLRMIPEVLVWDDASRLVFHEDGKGNVTEYRWDSLDRKTHVIFADGTMWQYAHDVHDNVVVSEDPNGSVVRYRHDLLDRVVRKDVTPAAGVSSATTFEILTWDGRSRLVRAEDDDSIVEREYDSLSNVVSETTDGTRTVSDFDGVGNQIVCAYPGGREILRSFDELDRPRRIEDSAQGLVAEYAYVGPGRVERRDLGNGTRTEFVHDGMQGVASAPDDFGVRRIVRMRHSHVASGSVINDLAFAWDPRSSKTRSTDLVAGGRTRRFAYDSLERLVASQVRPSDAPGGAALRSTEYVLDDEGNRSLVRGGPSAGTYTLDATPAQPADAQVHQYTSTPRDRRSYDATGNLVALEVSSSGTTFVRTDANADGTVDIADAIFVLSFLFLGDSAPTCMDAADANGDASVDIGDPVAILFHLFAGGPAFPPPFSSCGVVPEGRPSIGCASHAACGSETTQITLEYDYRNRLVRHVDPENGVEVTFSHDVFGRRLSKSVDDGVAARQTRFFYDGGWQVLEEQDSQGATLATFVHGKGTDEILQMRRAGDDYYFHGDDQHSVVALTDTNGAVVERYAYDDYGLILQADGLTPVSGNASSVGNPYFFTGRRFDPETGLYHYRARDYDPRAGRFIQRDPLGYVDGLNLFEYVNGDPLSRTDPYGLEDGEVSVWDVLVTVVSSVVASIANSPVDPKSVSDTTEIIEENAESIGENIENVEDYVESQGGDTDSRTTGIDVIDWLAGKFIDVRYSSEYKEKKRREKEEADRRRRYNENRGHGYDCGTHYEGCYHFCDPEYDDADEETRREVLGED